ncbi:hypothetical protein Ancab_012597 [Ancistrocladus abbreviatus]
MAPFGRLVHMLAMKEILQRKGKQEVAVFLDSTMMNSLEQEKKINLPYLMLGHMAQVIDQPSHELPYGMWLMKMFRHFKVPLREKDVAAAQESQIFNDISAAPKKRGVVAQNVMEESEQLVDVAKHSVEASAEVIDSSSSKGLPYTDHHDIAQGCKQLECCSHQLEMHPHRLT